MSVVTPLTWSNFLLEGETLTIAIAVTVIIMEQHNGKRVLTGEAPEYWRL